jgi:predicted DNA-binding protein
MVKLAITARVPECVAQKLDFLASERGMTRQDLIEEFLTEAVAETEVPNSFRANLYMPQEILDSIREAISNIPSGKEIGLKKLVGPKIWSRLDNLTRRNFGKEFKERVQNGEFSDLSVGRKRSNNEQQYNRK